MDCINGVASVDVSPIRDMHHSNRRKMRFKGDFVFAHYPQAAFRLICPCLLMFSRSSQPTPSDLGEGTLWLAPVPTLLYSSLVELGCNHPQTVVHVVE